MLNIDAFAWETASMKQVVYLTNDGHVHELSVQKGGSWKHTDLTKEASAPKADVFDNKGGTIAGYVWEKAGTKQVVYLSGGHIHELYKQQGSSWKYADLTKIAGAPAVVESDLVGYAWEGGGSKQVVYIAKDGIHELYIRQGETWKDANLTKLAGAPKAYYLSSAYGWDKDGSKQVVYMSDDGIHELYIRQGETWKDANLTKLAGAPDAFVLGSAYGWDAGGSKQVVFGYSKTPYDPNELNYPLQIDELYIEQGKPWKYADLTQLTGAPLVSNLSGYLGSAYAWKAGGSKQVVYFDGNHIYELFVQQGKSWQYADLTKLTNAPSPSPSSALIGYAWEVGSTKQVVYLTNDGHIHELFVPKGGAWSHADLTQLTGAPPAFKQVTPPPPPPPPK